MSKLKFKSRAYKVHWQPQKGDIIRNILYLLRTQVLWSARPILKFMNKLFDYGKDI